MCTENYVNMIIGRSIAISFWEVALLITVRVFVPRQSKFFNVKPRVPEVRMSKLDFDMDLLSHKPMSAFAVKPPIAMDVIRVSNCCWEMQGFRQLLVGFFDGFLVGFLLGFFDGFLEGFLLGFFDGFLEGFFDGFLLGFLEGFLLGVFDGFLEGFLLGVFAGFLEGFFDGLLEGF
jgi:hypothetical protein